MEFTYDGIVRCGFGFYNPNHAAAFICAILPFVWLLFLPEKTFKKLLGAGLSCALFAALALTYSRTGVLVAFLEGAAFALFCGRKYWKIFLAAAGVLFLAVALSGGWGRWSLDASAANRLEIWRAGISLFAANPFGVGLGNSGEIASAFLLPADIDCRTLVNSHLTLLCELGIFAGALWLLFIFYAAANGFAFRKSPLRLAALIALLGLIASSSLSSVFDFDVLFNPQKYEHFTTLNIALQWMNVLVFLVACIALCWGNFSARRGIFSVVLSLGLLLGLLLAGRTFAPAPKVQKSGGVEVVGYFQDAPERLAIFCGDFNLKSVLRILRKHNLDKNCAVAIRPFISEKLPDINAEQIILFGNCADYANTTKKTCILINPPSHFSPQNNNISQIYLPKWNPKSSRLKQQFPAWREL